MLTLIGFAVVLFITTNIDDIFVLSGFFANPGFRPREIIIGQYIGIAMLVAVSLVASTVSILLPSAYVGLLGILPIIIGVKALYDLWRGDEDDDAATKTGKHNSLIVAAVTIANGGDNIGVYTPIFATNPFSATIIILIVFIIMVAVWIALSYWLVNHPSLGKPLRRFGHIATPIVLILIGALVMYEAETVHLIL
ncbi:cadmium resistance transporter [Agrobacterium sp. SUL3]|uniref:cadmium resistance transporter n=1 Tax=Agrobacterium sp. SUL3 TaxID=1701910 RepID=UPI00069AD30B|nr:cadmium resistance transporter [Agrobacterium sp. SUL3]KNY30950.1 hypothetical protein AKG12_27015 [Agrobacterium sp. SUL3]